MGISAEAKKVLDSLTPDQVLEFVKQKEQEKANDVLRQIEELDLEMEKLEGELREAKEEYKKLSGESYKKVEQRQKMERKKKVYEAWKADPDQDLVKVVDDIPKMVISGWVRKWEDGEGIPA